MDNGLSFPEILTLSKVFNLLLSTKLNLMTSMRILQLHIFIFEIFLRLAEVIK